MSLRHSIEDFKSKFPKIKALGFICWECFTITRFGGWPDNFSCQCGYIFNHASVSVEYAVEKCKCGGWKVINNNEILGCTKCVKVTTLVLGDTGINRNDSGSSENITLPTEEKKS